MSRPLLALVLAALLAAPLAAASTHPEGAESVEVGTRAVWRWVGNETTALASVEPGASASLGFAVPVEPPSPNATGLLLWLNVTSADLGIANESREVNLTYGANATGAANATHRVLLVPFTAPANESDARYSFSIEGFWFEENATRTLAPGAAQATVTVRAPVPPAEGVPTTWIVAGAAGVLVLGGAGAYALKQRADRKRMNQAPRRSQAMREMQLERDLEKAREKDPEKAAVIQEEIRVQEQVREKRRELQILEAKRADVLKTMELLRKRHEAGGLSKLQFDNMMAKKQADLERIEAEIAQMEREDAGAAA